LPGIVARRLWALPRGHPQASERIIRNLAALLAGKPIVANRKIDTLAFY